MSKHEYYPWEQTIKKDRHYNITIGEKHKGRTYSLLKMKTALQKKINRQSKSDRRELDV